jgi:hypothetical protein
MPAKPLSDAELKRTLEAVERCATQVEAARELGIDRRTITNRLEQARKRGLHLSEGVRDLMRAARLSGAELRGGWQAVLDDEGQKIANLQFSVAKQDLADSQSAIEHIREVFEGLTPAPVVTAPQHTEADLLTLYPLADVHMGLQAWGKETGEDYDTKRAAERVKTWVAQCVAASPASETAVILGVGDLTHADDQTNMTRKSHHVVDVDTRHYNTIEITIETLAASIECAAMKHNSVRVHIIPGNHDPHAYLGILFGLANRYRDNPRIKVQKTPGEWFVRQHGKVMIAAHHGDKAKADRMVHFIADQYAELWGKTRHRFLFTGHLHHHKSADIGGVQWEQLRAVTARDAYAVSHAYAARAQLQAITFHREKGEVSRVKVNGF